MTLFYDQRHVGVNFPTNQLQSKSKVYYLAAYFLLFTFQLSGSLNSILLSFIDVLVSLHSPCIFQQLADSHIHRDKKWKTVITFSRSAINKKQNGGE